MCEWCGCSVFLTEEDARKKASAIPYLRKKLLAKGTLTPEWGAIAQTGQKPHYTWWIVEGKIPTPLFTVITT